MGFGENWLADIDKRLSEKHPELSESDLRKADKLCRKITKNANDFVSKNPIKKEGKITFVDSSDFKTYILNQHSWINEENLNRLYSQSCYYAMK
tara:strand:- start:20 stop:301 length:282 start_codon:yes stop_codon:yes gene_type:complete